MILFSVEGEPIPQGSKKGFVVGRRAVLVDDNKDKLKPWRAKVAAASDVGHTFTGPVFVAAVFYLPRPKTVKRLLPSVKPDLDKLFRALGDGMTDGGLITDDSLIVSKHVMKRYADERNHAGVRVLVMEDTATPFRPDAVQAVVNRLNREEE
jgi:Holliday junction resolvase RusA-like endonuclease